MIDLREVKTFVGGIQGSGKTYFTANTIIPSFKKPVVYGVHPVDYAECKCKILIPKNYNTDELDRNCLIIKKMALDGECDCFILDESDWFIPNNIQSLKAFHNLYDLIVNHRHYKKGYPQKDNKNLKGLAIVFITRRPQSIPTEIMESCEYQFTFAIEGDNVVKKYSSIHPMYRDLIPQLKKEKHNFIFKKLGEAPKIMSGAVHVKNQKGGITAKHGN